MNKRIAFVLALALALTLVGCNKEKSNENNEKHIFQGEIIEFDNGAMLVEPLEGYSEAEYAQRIRVVIQNMPGSPEPRVGDVIEVTYSGIMTEESPPSPTGVPVILYSSPWDKRIHVPSRSTFRIIFIPFLFTLLPYFRIRIPATYHLNSLFFHPMTEPVFLSLPPQAHKEQNGPEEMADKEGQKKTSSEIR